MDFRHEFNLYTATMSYRLRVRYNITIIVQSRAYWRIPNMVINAYALQVRSVLHHNRHGNNFTYNTPNLLCWDGVFVQYGSQDNS